MHHPIDRIPHITTFVTPIVEHWLERGGGGGEECILRVHVLNNIYLVLIHIIYLFTFIIITITIIYYFNLMRSCV